MFSQGCWYLRWCTDRHQGWPLYLTTPWVATWNEEPSPSLLNHCCPFPRLGLSWFPLKIPINNTHQVLALSGTSWLMYLTQWVLHHCLSWLPDSPPCPPLLLGPLQIAGQGFTVLAWISTPGFYSVHLVVTDKFSFFLMWFRPFHQNLQLIIWERQVGSSQLPSPGLSLIWLCNRARSLFSLGHLSHSSCIWCTQKSLPRIQSGASIVVGAWTLERSCRVSVFWKFTPYQRGWTQKL